ncbi:hypothetical protein EUTSA_v10022943mg [Eutrema salsugineum]|uniref:Uncharacterized protein n=1 Tax=Eutrema salsugineum TaxID=72664 RepID=V4MF71_EUTSA|nr:hypothetical protein EUTSA_v10022943mg [Eutrema salsugineum]
MVDRRSGKLPAVFVGFAAVLFQIIYLDTCLVFVPRVYMCFMDVLNLVWASIGIISLAHVIALLGFPIYGNEDKKKRYVSS